MKSTHLIGLTLLTVGLPDGLYPVFRRKVPKEKEIIFTEEELLTLKTLSGKQKKEYVKTLREKYSA